MKRTGRLSQLLVQLGFVAALLLSWHFLTVTGAVHSLLLPTMPSVWAEFVKIVTSGEFWPDLQVTLYEFAISIGIFLPLGLCIGYFVSRSRFATRTFDPLLSALYAIPQVIFLPVFILYFGIGPGSKIAIGVATGFFPVVLNTITGLTSVSPLYVAAARSMGATGFRMFWSVMVPAAFPVVLNGVRIALIISFLSILGTETLVSLAGLGHRVVTAAELMDSPSMFAYILLVVVIAAILNYLVSAVETRGAKHR